MIIEKVSNGFIVKSGNPGYEKKHIYTEDDFFNLVLSSIKLLTYKMKPNVTYELHSNITEESLLYKK